MQPPLIKEKRGVKNGQVDASFYVRNDIRLQQKKVGIKYYQVIKSSDINKCSTFLPTGSKFLDYKDQKTEKYMSLDINQIAMPLKLVKRFVDKGLYVIIKGIDI